MLEKIRKFKKNRTPPEISDFCHLRMSKMRVGIFLEIGHGALLPKDNVFNAQI